MNENEGILSWRRWLAVGLAFVVLLAVLIGGTVANQPPAAPEEPWPTVAPPWRIGQTAIVKARTSAADAAGPASKLGAACVMVAGAKGTVVELGRSLSDPRIYVELQTDGCDGWVPAGALRRP